MILLVVLVALVTVQSSKGPTALNTHVADASDVPLLAHYYIWFDRTSWQRAKQDLPLLGPYSSDDESVMRQHVVWAKQAGIRGFIVSWKSTDSLNSRLKQLIKIADEEDFKLEITYQGLDFDRNPLPIEQVVSDLQYFSDNFASDQAFNLFSKPVVVLTGTPQYSRDDLSRLEPLRTVFGHPGIPKEPGRLPGRL